MNPARVWLVMMAMLHFALPAEWSAPTDMAGW
jgi:hypothetical protein